MSRKCQLLVCVLVVVLLSAPSVSFACGCHRAAAVTYAPATAVQTVGYAPAVAVQSVGYAPTPVCSTCAPATAYLPVATYRAVYRPVVVAPVTAYRPVTSVVYSASLVPYASYSPVAAVPVTTAMPITTAMPVVVPATTCSSCAVAPAATIVPAPTCSQCSAATTTYRIGDSYSIVSSSASPSCPTSDCGTPVAAQMPLSTSIVPTSTIINSPTPAPAAGSVTTPAPAAAPAGKSIYEQQNGIPAGTPSAPGGTPVPGTGTNTNANPTPASKPNVMPAAQPVVRQAAYITPVSQTAPTTTILSDDGWHGVGK